MTSPSFLASLQSPLSVAPMIDWTYSHFRVLMRVLAPHALLYTDMQTTGAILHNPTRALARHAIEHPVALQLGGADKKALVRCAIMAQEQGFSEINLNLGCPSDKVQAGRFGACLMAEPEQVAACISALKRAVSIPVTAKTRIGIDHQDSYEFFASFVDRLLEAGCDKLIVHARKAWLTGLNPKQNRTVPPVNYEYVYRIKQQYPSIPIVINGNITTLEDINTHLTYVDGVMLGRLVCQNPYALATLHHALYPDTPQPTRFDVLQQYLAYLHALPESRLRMSVLLKPIFNMAHALSDAKVWKAGLMAIQRSHDLCQLNDLIDRFCDVD